MADQGHTSFGLSTNGVDHSSSSLSSDKCASAADARLYEEIAIVYTTKLDDMDVFNRSLESYSLNDITNCIARESKPDMKNIVHHSSRTENTASYERVLKKIEELNEKSSLKNVGQNENKCTSLSHDNHQSNKKGTDKLHNNNNSEDNIHGTNTHHTLSKMHEKNKDTGTVKIPSSSSCINLSSDEDSLLSNGDKTLTKSSGVKVTKNRNIAKRKRKNNRRKAIQNIKDATLPASFIELSSDEDIVIINDDEILTRLTGTNSSKKSRVSIIDDNSDTEDSANKDNDQDDDDDDDVPLIRLKCKKQISDKLQEVKHLSIDLEDITFRKRTLKMKPHNGAGFLYCGKWFSLSKLSSADLKRTIRNVYLFFHDKCTQMIDVYTIEDGHMTEHMKVNSNRNTVTLKNYLNSKETIEIECHCWYEREQANLKALELGILTDNNVMFMKQSHKCQQNRCVCCCSTQNCEENFEMQASQEASRIEVCSVAENYDWIRCLKSIDSNAACLINKCLTYDRFNSNEKTLETFSSIVQKRSMPKSSFNTIIDKIETKRKKLLVPKRTVPTKSVKGPKQTDSPELSVSQKVKNVAELMDSLITKTVCSPTTKSLEQESATIDDEIKEIERNNDFVSAKVPDNSSSVSQCENISAEKDDLGVDSLITTIIERFQGVRLAINEKGKVTASLNMQINTLSVTEIEVLSKIITQAQQQVDALGLVPGTNLEYFNTDKCSLGQTTITKDTLQSSNHNPVVIDKTSPSFNLTLNTSDNVPCTIQDVVSLEAVRNKLKSIKRCSLQPMTDNGRQSNNDSQVSIDEIILSDDENHSKSSNIIESSEADISNDFYKMFSSVERSRSDCYRKSFLTLTRKISGYTSDSEHPESSVVPLVADKSKRESKQIINRHKTRNDRPVMVIMDKAILSNHDNVLASDITLCSAETEKVSKIYEKLAKIAMKRNICYRKSLSAFYSKSSAYFSTSDPSSKNTKGAQQTARRKVTSGVPAKKRKTVTDSSSKTGKKQNSPEPNITLNRSNGNRRLEVLASSSKDPKLSHQESVSLALHEEIDIKPEVVYVNDGVSDDLGNEDWVRAIKEEEANIAQQVEIIAKINFGNE